MYFDTHVHLNNPRLLSRLPKVLADAKRAKVTRMLVVGYDHETNEEAIRLSEAHDELYAAIGYHPVGVEKRTEEDFVRLAKMLSHPKVVALGECGLDHYHDKDHKQEQASAFERHIALAKASALPLVVHMRDAARDTLAILKKHAPVHGVMHCYSGSVEMSADFIDIGMHISLGGPLTFLNAKTPKAVAEAVPLDKLLIETDAPYLAPHPHRGKMNHPALVVLVAEALSRIKDIPLESVAEKTTENAMKLFFQKEL